MTDRDADAFVRECVAIAKANRGVHLELAFQTAIAMVGTLQLALRHPANGGPTARLMRGFVDNLIEHLVAVAGGSEVIRRGLRAGDDPRHDVPRGGGLPVIAHTSTTAAGIEMGRTIVREGHGIGVGIDDGVVGVEMGDNRTKLRPAEARKLAEVLLSAADEAERGS